MAIVAAGVVACGKGGMRSGDLVFVVEEAATESTMMDATMDAAIIAATGSAGLSVTHVGIIEIAGDSTMVIDATPRHGVSRRPWSDFASEMLGVEEGNMAPNDSTCNRDFASEMMGNEEDNSEMISPEGNSRLVVMRVRGRLDEEAVIRRARALVGRPYDLTFIPDNDSYYCSELVQVCFRHGDLRPAAKTATPSDPDAPLFPAAPMNFRSPDGTFPEYWESLFAGLGMPIPQDVPGTNPHDMMLSPLLVPISWE